MTFVPATMFCERCFAQLDDWRVVASIGTVFTYTVLHLDLDEQRLNEPQILAYIRLDGCDGGLVHFVANALPEDVHIGMRVRAAWKPSDMREGSITDVRFFEPLPDQDPAA
jgi:uncharacterized OB-fold protein